LNLKLDRAAKTSLAEQIRLGITAAIGSGVLAPGARLPSWLVLAAQLGVARGTVKTAYERLVDEQLIVSSRSSGTRVADHPVKAAGPGSSVEPDRLPPPYDEFFSGPAIFQNGVPASDCLPVTLLARLRAHAARAEVAAPAIYPDPRGEPELKREIAAHLMLSRGIECRPSQIFITAGFSGALGVTLRILGAEGRTAWIENPGFPPSRRALEISRLSTVPIPVDRDGIDVSYGLKHAPDAALALVTPGQQAPLGATLSLARRVQLIDWATRTGAWIIEDDYLGELQLMRRAAPGLASLDRTGRVIHIGSFSKTISPTLRLGFIVAPAALASEFAEAAACLAPAPGPAVQSATAEFMRDGHYMRHLRRMKRVYASRSDALQAMLESMGFTTHPAGLTVLLRLPDGARDSVIAREAYAYGLGPSPLSAWFSPVGIRRSGLLLGVATATGDRLSMACDRLHQLIRTFS
jgi:GntR family transcriptional regulator/MocR family aminotransferase